jgi:heterodisulfide reductase subunit A-like polyferredoxin
MRVMQYNAETIGAGQAGVPLATTLAQAGDRTILVEREHSAAHALACIKCSEQVADLRLAGLAHSACSWLALTH